MTVDPRKPISGKAGGELTCPPCRQGPGRAEMPPVTRHPIVRGSRFVGYRGLRNLLVCPHCEAVWSTFVNPHEGWTGYRRLGPEALPLFAAETTLGRWVDWVASFYSDDVYGPISALARMILRRRPEGLRTGVQEAMARLEAGLDDPTPVGVERVTMLVRAIGWAVERAARGDLRATPKPRPPARIRPELLAAAWKGFVSHERRYAYRACNREVLERTVVEGWMTDGAPSARIAVLALETLDPLWRLVDDPPLGGMDDGTRRGVHLRAWWQTVETVHGVARMPWNDHALFMPPPAWRLLVRRVEAVRRLDRSMAHILDLRDEAAADLPPAILQEGVLFPHLLRRGPRLTAAARSELERCRSELGRAGGDNRSLAAESIAEMLHLDREVKAADGRSSFRREPPPGE